MTRSARLLPGALLAALVAAFVAAALGGCGTATPRIAEETPVLTPAPPGATIGQLPGGAESPVTPGVLDRDFTDTEQTRAERERLISDWVDPAVKEPRVVEAMRAVPRHSFVPTESRALAYEDRPLPIGHGQTISQPSLVGTMTELLQVQEGDRVLEIGTGSGYQAAILAELTDEVYTVEIVPELAGAARSVLDRLGYREVKVERRDGYHGWKEHAPFDAIVVTAAPDHLPSPLVQQLKPDGGRMVIPIGPVGDVQTLWLVTRNGEEVDMQRVLEVRFVPFTRQGEPRPTGG